MTLPAECLNKLWDTFVEAQNSLLSPQKKKKKKQQQNIAKGCENSVLWVHTVRSDSQLKGPAMTLLISQLVNLAKNSQIIYERPETDSFQNIKLKYKREAWERFL